MLAILRALTDEQLTRDLGSYYHSIIGMLNHVLLADIIWLRRLAGFLPELAELGPATPDVQFETLSDVVWGTLDEFEPIRAQVDDTLKQAVATFPDAELSSRFQYKNREGMAQDKVGSQILLHVFNHQTHHRGGIATMLDILGIDNDYSNLVRLKF
jgi:uncharacterized damage-inducible protein DinB